MKIISKLKTFYLAMSTHHKIQSGSVITLDSHQIRFDHYGNKSDKVVIIAHGFFNSKDALLLKELGQELVGVYDVIIMNFRGHGTSDGLFHWTAKEYLDLTAVVEYAKKQCPEISRLFDSLEQNPSLIEEWKKEFGLSSSEGRSVSGVRIQSRVCFVYGRMMRRVCV